MEDCFQQPEHKLDYVKNSKKSSTHHIKEHLINIKLNTI
jgi:hypothetical protein